MQGSVVWALFFVRYWARAMMANAHIFVFLMKNYLILIVKITLTLLLGVIVYVRFVMDVLHIAWKDVDDDCIGGTFRCSRAECRR